VQAFLRDDGDTSSVKEGDKVWVKYGGDDITSDETYMFKGKWYQAVITRDDGMGIIV
jgi:hypothetical protein